MLLQNIFLKNTHSHTMHAIFKSLTQEQNDIFLFRHNDIIFCGVRHRDKSIKLST